MYFQISQVVIFKGVVTPTRTSPSKLPTRISRIHRKTRISKTYRGELRISKILDAYIVNADLYRRLFSYLEQLEDPVRLRTPEAEAKLDTGDAALYRQLFTYPCQKNKMILIQEMLLIKDNSPHICCRSNRDNFGTGCSLQTALHRHVVEAADKQDNLETTYAVLYIQLR